MSRPGAHAEGAFPFPRLETERLVLRLPTLQDAAAVCVHFSDAAVTKYLFHD